MRIYFLLAWVIVLAALCGGTTTYAADQTWKSAAFTDGNWNVGNNWVGLAVPGGATGVASGDTATFNDGGNLNVTPDATRNIKNITFDTASAGAFTISGGGLVLTNAGAITINSAVTNTETINTNLLLSTTASSTYSFINNSSTSGAKLNIGGSVTGQASATNEVLTLGGTNGGTVSGTIGNGSGGGTVGITKNGAGTWSLSSANTYSGGTTISVGVLNLGNALAAQNSTVTVSATNGLTFGTGLTPFTIGGLAGANSFALTDISAVAINLRVGNNNASTSYTGAMSGSGSLTKIGNGALTLTANNNYTGDTTVNAGTINASGANTPTGGAITASNIIVNSGGTISATGDNSFIGQTASASKTITINTGGTISASNTTRSNHLHALVMNGGTLSVPGAATGTAATYGNWNFDFGVTTPSTGGVTSTISGGNATMTQNLTGGTHFNIQSTHILDVSTVLASTGTVTGFALIKEGTGTLNLTALNTYTPGTNITGGTLLANTAVSGTNTATGTGPVTVGASGTLGGIGQIRPTGTNGITVNGTLAPGASIGTLTIDSAGSTAASILTMASGSLFQFELGAPGVSLASVGTGDRLVINGSAVGDVTFNNNTINFLSTGSVGFYKLFDTSLAVATIAGDTWAGLTYDTTTGVVSAGLLASNLNGIGTFIVGTASNGGNVGDIYLSVVPEPSSLAMMLFGSAIMWVVRKKRQC